MSSVSVSILLCVTAIASGSPPQTLQGDRRASDFSWEDYDADGLVDGLAVTLAGGLRLLRNERDGPFDDVSGDAGLAGARAASLGPMQNYYGDGQIDLLFGTEKGRADALARAE